MRRLAVGQSQRFTISAELGRACLGIARDLGAAASGTWCAPWLVELELARAGQLALKPGLG